MPHIHYGQLSAVSISKNYPETPERAYFDGTFTSNVIDTECRVVHESNFPSIIEQVTAGVRVLDSHKHETNGFGKTITASLNENKVDGTLYILKGATLENGEFEPMRLDSQSYPTTGSWIMGVKDGMIDKLSIGWYSERDICNLCGNSIWRYPCRHYPGERFPITNEDTGEETMELCTYSCYGVTVVEVSFVYFGANPDARLVAKAKALAADKVFSSEQIDRIESKLKTAIIEQKRSVFDMGFTKEQTAEIMTIVTAAIEKAGDVKAASPDAPVDEGMLTVRNAAGTIVRQLRADELPEEPKPVTVEDINTAMATAIQPLSDKVAALEEGLSQGETPADRQKAVDANLKQYRRVYGKDGDEESHLAYLETLPDIAKIELSTKEYKAFADEKFGGGGRKTDGVLDELESDDDNDPPSSTANPM